MYNGKQMIPYWDECFQDDSGSLLFVCKIPQAVFYYFISLSLIYVVYISTSIYIYGLFFYLCVNYTINLYIYIKIRMCFGCCWGFIEALLLIFGITILSLTLVRLLWVCLVFYVWMTW